MKKILVMGVIILVVVACGSLEIKESEGDEERFSRMPGAEEKVIYSEFRFEDVLDPYYIETAPEYDFRLDEE